MEDTGISSTLAARLKELEAERDQLQKERQQAAERAGLKKRLAGITFDDLASAVQGVTLPGGIWKPEVLLRDKRGNAIGGRTLLDIPRARLTLATLCERIELDPATRAFQVHCRIPLLKKPGKTGSVGQRWRPHGDACYSPVGLSG